MWVNNNAIDDYNPLGKYKTLEIINIRRNYIKNIDNLIPFIGEFKGLKKLDISYNNIDFKDNKNIFIIFEAGKRLYEINYF